MIPDFTSGEKKRKPTFSWYKLRQAKICFRKLCFEINVFTSQEKLSYCASTMTLLQIFTKTGQGMALKDNCRLESPGRYKREWCWVSCVEMQISLCKAGPGLLRYYCFSSSLLFFPAFFSSPFSLFSLTLTSCFMSAIFVIYRKNIYLVFIHTSWLTDSPNPWTLLTIKSINYTLQV